MARLGSQRVGDGNQDDLLSCKCRPGAGCLAGPARRGRVSGRRNPLVGGPLPGWRYSAIGADHRDGRLSPLHSLLSLHARPGNAVGLGTRIPVGRRRGRRFPVPTGQSVPAIGEHSGGGHGRLRGLPERSQTTEQSLLQHAPSGLFHHTDASAGGRAAGRRSANGPHAAALAEDLRRHAHAKAGHRRGGMCAVRRRVRAQLCLRDRPRRSAAGGRSRSRQSSSAAGDPSRVTRGGGTKTSRFASDRLPKMPPRRCQTDEHTAHC